MSTNTRLVNDRNKGWDNNGAVGNDIEAAFLGIYEENEYTIVIAFQGRSLPMYPLTKLVIPLKGCDRKSGLG